MDPVFATIVIAFLITIVALVAIIYGQKDIAALAIETLGQGEKLDSLEEQNEKELIDKPA